MKLQQKSVSANFVKLRIWLESVNDDRKFCLQGQKQHKICILCVLFLQLINDQGSEDPIPFCFSQRSEKEPRQTWAKNELKTCHHRKSRYETHYIRIFTFFLFLLNTQARPKQLNNKPNDCRKKPESPIWRQRTYSLQFGGFETGRKTVWMRTKFGTVQIMASRGRAKFCTIKFCLGGIFCANRLS